MIIKPCLNKLRTHNVQVVNSGMTPLNEEERKKSIFALEPSNMSAIKDLGDGEDEEEKEI